MFFSEQALRVTIQDTQEGRVFHPWSRTGDGYLVDAPTERRLARFLDRYFFGQITLMMPFMIWGSETGHRAVATICFIATLMAIRQLCLRHILRAAPRTDARFTKAEAWQRIAAEHGGGRICLLGFVMLSLPLGLVLAARNEDRWDFALLIAIYVAVVSYGAYVCMRLLRVKATLGRSVEAERRASIR